MKKAKWEADNYFYEKLNVLKRREGFVPIDKTRLRWEGCAADYGY